MKPCFPLLCLLLITLFSVSKISAQKTADSRANFTARALVQVRNAIAENEGVESAEVKAKMRSEQEIKNALGRLAEEKKITFSKLESLKEMEKSFLTGSMEQKKLQVKQTASAQGSATPVSSKAMNWHEELVKEKKEAEQTLKIIDEKEKALNEELKNTTAAREKAERDFETNSTRRKHQLETLDKLTNELIVNSSKENFDLLLEFITTAACENNAEAKPLWKTKPNPGAIIYYQSQGERRRGVVPHAVQPTDAARGICVGTYYIWAERNNKVTSDKNLIYEIDLNYPEVVVTEFNPNE